MELKTISSYNLAARRDALVAEGILRNIPEDASSAFLSEAVERCETHLRLAGSEFGDWLDEMTWLVMELKDRLTLARAAELREKND